MIEAYEKAHGYCPSQREIADYYGVTQPTIFYYLHKMAKEGSIRVVDRKHRKIILLLKEGSMKTEEAYVEREAHERD
jgi:predicted transcriptional regulator